jgi:hypothetical protein
VDNDPVNWIDLWGLQGNQQQARSQTDVNIEDSIEKIKQTAFGQSEEGERIIKELESMHNDGRITVKELGSDTRAIYYPPVPIFRPEAKIMIDDDLPVDAYPGRLGHEGTHLMDNLGGIPYDLSAERRAFDNAYSIDRELGSSVQDNPSDAELANRYPSLPTSNQPDIGVKTMNNNSNSVKGK